MGTAIIAHYSCCCPVRNCCPPPPPPPTHTPRPSPTSSTVLRSLPCNLLFHFFFLFLIKQENIPQDRQQRLEITRTGERERQKKVHIGLCGYDIIKFKPKKIKWKTSGLIGMLCIPSALQLAQRKKTGGWTLFVIIYVVVIVVVARPFGARCEAGGRATPPPTPLLLPPLSLQVPIKLLYI